MRTSPDYLAYTVPCPLNAGKLAQVEAFVNHWRELAGREAAWQWQRFFQTRGVDGFETSARQGWARPWIASRESSVTLAQQVMAQVAGQLKGHLGNVQNTFVDLVAKSSLSSDDKHRLFYLNRCKLWLASCAVKSPIKGEAHLSQAIQALGRRVFRKALSMHRRPSFRHYHPQLDQRSVKLSPSQGTGFPWWATVSTLEAGKTLHLPVAVWPELERTIAATSNALAPLAAEAHRAKREKAAAQRESSGKPKAKRSRPVREAERCSLPHTVRLILRPATRSLPHGKQSLSLGLVVDHQALRTQSREAYRPIPGKIVAFDLGLATFLATSDGDLLGRGWMDKLQRWDQVLLGIARGQQKRGLPVRTPRYRALTQRLDGFLKTEVFRLINAWVERVKPEKIVREAVHFHHQPQLSKRMNRLLSRFGKRYLEQALQRLEATHGIAVETREASYSSQQCHRCGYTDEKNRSAQSKFDCRFCGNRCHADVNAARVVRDRRSVAVSPSTRASRRRVLHTQVTAFQAAHPCLPRPVSPRGQPLARGRRDDPRWGNPYFQHVLTNLLNNGKPHPTIGVCT
jgi:putative transposase